MAGCIVLERANDDQLVATELGLKQRLELGHGILWVVRAHNRADDAQPAPIGQEVSALKLEGKVGHGHIDAFGEVDRFYVIIWTSRIIMRITNRQRGGLSIAHKQRTEVAYPERIVFEPSDEMHALEGDVLCRL